MRETPSFIAENVLYGIVYTYGCRSTAYQTMSTAEQRDVLPVRLPIEMLFKVLFYCTTIGIFQLEANNRRSNIEHSKFGGLAPSISNAILCICLCVFGISCLEL